MSSDFSIFFYSTNKFGRAFRLFLFVLQHVVMSLQRLNGGRTHNITPAVSLSLHAVPASVVSTGYRRTRELPLVSRLFCLCVENVSVWSLSMNQRSCYSSNATPLIACGCRRLNDDRSCHSIDKQMFQLDEERPSYCLSRYITKSTLIVHDYLMQVIYNTII